MGARSLARGIVAVLVAGAPAWPADSPGSSQCCATIAPGWMLFADESHTVPDCWRLDRIEVQEISICEHCIQFSFIADEGGSPHLTALVFPVPTAHLVETRMGIPPHASGFLPMLANLERSYEILLTSLAAASGGRLVPGTRIRFDSKESKRPLIHDPSRRLGFAWDGHEFLLRGYLDVYLTLLS